MDIYGVARVLREPQSNAPGHKIFTTVCVIRDDVYSITAVFSLVQTAAAKPLRYVSIFNMCTIPHSCHGGLDPPPPPNTAEPVLPAYAHPSRSVFRYTRCLCTPEHRKSAAEPPHSARSQLRHLAVGSRAIACRYRIQPRRVARIIPRTVGVASRGRHILFQIPRPLVGSLLPRDNVQTRQRFRKKRAYWQQLHRPKVVYLSQCSRSS